MYYSKKAARVARLAVAALVFGVTIPVAAPLAQAQAAPIPKKHIYPETSAAQGDIDAALAEAKKTHKRIILDFGGDWCPDCQVLNIYFGEAPNAELLAKYFIRVNVNIGHMDTNRDIALKYGVPLKGVPALAVVGSDGKLIYAQTSEFADMRHLESQSLTDFLNKWKK